MLAAETGGVVPGEFHTLDLAAGEPLGRDEPYLVAFGFLGPGVEVLASIM